LIFWCQQPQQHYPKRSLGFEKVTVHLFKVQGSLVPTHSTPAFRSLDLEHIQRGHSSFNVERKPHDVSALVHTALPPRVSLLCIFCEGRLITRDLLTSHDSVVSSYRHSRVSSNRYPSLSHRQRLRHTTKDFATLNRENDRIQTEALSCAGRSLTLPTPVRSYLRQTCSEQSAYLQAKRKPHKPVSSSRSKRSNNSVCETYEILKKHNSHYHICKRK
jgi:hypothetical protein